MGGHACAVAVNGGSTEASSSDLPLASGSGVTASDVQHDMGRHDADGIHVLKRGEITQAPRAARTHRELQQDVKKTGRAIMQCLEMCGMLTIVYNWHARDEDTRRLAGVFPCRPLDSEARRGGRR
jgi:hypothetical protein